MAACEETREQMEKELSEYLAEGLGKFLRSKKPKNRAKNRSQYEQIFLDSDKELFEQFKNSEYSIKKKPKEIKNPIIQRKSTIVNVALKLISIILDAMFNPEFDHAAQAKKEEIWGYSKGESAINPENNAEYKKGDHIWGTNEVPLDDKNGIKLIGSDTAWNMLPCTHVENINWKKITIEGYDDIKNIVYDFHKITPEIFKLMEPEKQEYYNNYEKWKKYCDTRNARMYHTIPTKTFDMVNTIVVEVLDKMAESIRQLIVTHNLQEFNTK
tara:strand:+ start:461 stop:1270 length:810 start_codon:yes stop_codon:yes gene_type:complete